MPIPPDGTEQPPRPPEDALQRLLPPDVRRAIRSRHPAAIEVWHGVVWGRLGRGDLAWDRFDRVDRVDAPALQPWIAAEQGRILRELGLHAHAETIEASALLQATDPVDAAMLSVSLTADAVGLGDRTEAVRRWDEASHAIAALSATPRAARQRLRLAWVAVEVAWLTGAEPPIAGLPWWDPTANAPAFPDDHAWGSDFHTSKGLLFAGIVHDDPRLLDGAARCAPPALLWAVHLARADRGQADAEVAARAAWHDIVPPPGFEGEVRRGPTAARLTAG